VTLGQGTATGTFYSDAAGTIPLTSPTWSGGTGVSVPGPHQVTFYYRDTVAGPHTLTVASPGLTGNSASLNVTPGPATKLAFAAVPSNANVDSPFSVIVTSQDAFGNVSPVTSNKTVTVALASGSGPLGGTFTGTITSGQSSVTFSNLTDHLAETISLTASTSGLTSTTSSTFAVAAGAAPHVAYLQQPAHGTGGSPITPAVTVKILDQFNNQAASNATVSLAFGNNPSGATNPTIHAIPPRPAPDRSILTYTVVGACVSGCHASKRRRTSAMTLMTQWPTTAISTIPANTPSESSSRDDSIIAPPRP